VRPIFSHALHFLHHLSAYLRGMSADSLRPVDGDEGCLSTYSLSFEGLNQKISLCARQESK
jgi:hypothetical protein